MMQLMESRIDPHWKKNDPLFMLNLYVYVFLSVRKSQRNSDDIEMANHDDDDDDEDEKRSEEKRQDDDDDDDVFMFEKE